MEGTNEIIIIGAGICGLAIARELSGKGKKVVVLEARNRAGGRIHTIRTKLLRPLEAGAEFIHGDLPLTKGLVKKAGGSYYEKQGRMYRSRNGKLYPVGDLVPGMDKVLSQIKKLEKDLTLSEFLRTSFNTPENEDIRNSMIKLAEGFDAADPDKISVFALRNEWRGGSLDAPLVIKESYDLLVKYLLKECEDTGCSVYLSKEVREIRWKPHDVTAQCADGSHYQAAQLVVTIPLGILASALNGKGSLRFIPAIRDKQQAANQIGYGPVLKVMFEFKTFFWKDIHFRKEVAQLYDLGFLMNESAFPMFWTGESKIPLITGWAGGNAAAKLKGASREELVTLAVIALAQSLNTSPEFIKSQLEEFIVFDWGIEPFSEGAYSYETPETKTAKGVLREPVENTVYFAGEALGETTGTVEAALESAAKTIRRIRNPDPNQQHIKV